eukprot:TRINITY_DN1694_c0_g2_i10.p3 TRINITY_DN1694_c0_g2~~TRINITY_DN1694_c0_g2_i10.p3  ORF type:complete len:106 (+),score=2.81 TRINITY_DN1694_c0_g2_i10:113-430(+)
MGIAVSRDGFLQFGWTRYRCCMAVVSSCREMFGQVRQRAQPTSLVASSSAGHSKETADDKSEEGVDDVKSSWPLRAGLHTCYNGSDNGLIPKTVSVRIVVCNSAA